MNGRSFDIYPIPFIKFVFVNCNQSLCRSKLNSYYLLFRFVHLFSIFFSPCSSCFIHNSFKLLSMIFLLKCDAEIKWCYDSNDLVDIQADHHLLFNSFLYLFIWSFATRNLLTLSCSNFFLFHFIRFYYRAILFYWSF